MTTTPKYALVTAARNEEEFIAKTINSVISQTILPQKWVIVSDGSTDRTDEIVRSYADNHCLIELLKKEAIGYRNFGSKVFAIRAGMHRLTDIQYDVIGVLDADVSFEPDYYERVLAELEQDNTLGIAGGLLYDRCGMQYRPQFTDVEWSVAGPVQMFRRECYEAIGGYLPLKRGGVDMMAEVMARMHGWRVKAFPHLKVLHHRRTGAGMTGTFLARFRQGIMEYANGYHPLFQAARCVYRLSEPPFLFGSILRALGYCWAFVAREQRFVPDEVVRHMRSEQKQRLQAMMSRHTTGANR